MRVVVTGATGNIGTALLRRLTRVPGHEIVGVCRRIPEVPPLPGPITWTALDLTENESRRTLEPVLEGADAVVHLAWGFQPSHRPEYLAELGVGGTTRVVSAASATGVPHLVHMSSIGAYSPKANDCPVDENFSREGVPTSPYSLHKAAAERVLDRHEERDDRTVITRFRPGIVGQQSAGSALLRYGLPALAPSWLLGHVPVLPLDRRLVLPMVHADDVADAVARALDRRTGGAFNLAADPPVTARSIADALGARLVHVPSAVLRRAMSAAWHARMQPVDAGWLDMAMALPLLDTSRARRELDWAPTHDAEQVLREVLMGMRERHQGPTPVLRARGVASAVGDLVRRGPVGQRRRP